MIRTFRVIFHHLLAMVCLQMGISYDFEAVALVLILCLGCIELKNEEQQGEY